MKERNQTFVVALHRPRVSIFILFYFMCLTEFDFVSSSAWRSVVCFTWDKKTSSNDEKTSSCFIRIYISPSRMCWCLKLKMGKDFVKRCFISGCYAKKDKENKEIAFFSVPAGALKTWQELIPKRGLSSASRLCSRHFDEADVVKGRTIQERFYPYPRWRLRVGAIPKHLLETENRSSSLVAQPSTFITLFVICST